MHIIGRCWRRVAAGVFATGFAILISAGARADPSVDPDDLVITDVTVSARPITSFSRQDAAQKNFGRLEFRGGLILTAPDQRHFGGWSGLVIDPDGKDFTAISDRGGWLMATIDYNGTVPTGVSNARIGPILAADGTPLDRGRDRDAEALAIVSGKAHQGSVIIAFEQNTRLARYDITPQGISPELQLLEKPSGASNMRRNNGFEAMTVMRGGPYKGAQIAISERLYDARRNHTGWIWTAHGILPFHLTNIGDFDITDVSSLDDGTLFVLERRFRWLEGVKMRIRRIDASALQPGKTIEGETLIEVNLEYEIDNMEGLSATRGSGNEVILTLISDDNFNASLQRTLLLQFALEDVQTAKTRP
ncbi:MAG TPA: esterase-like activity of phytase family protein [Hyphomicrobium sp.]|nr:esterase-like activity of phytase family protein [Hyphomicrobium sp.]